MKSLLNELVNPNTAVLTDTQKAVLCLTVVSNSPEMAFNSVTASQNLIHAAKGLKKLGLVNLAANELITTPFGEKMMRHHNLVDDGNMLTQDGKDILDAATEVGEIFNNQSVQESFNFLKTLG